MNSRLTRHFVAALAAFSFSIPAFAANGIPALVVREAPSSLHSSTSPTVMRERGVQVNAPALSQAATSGGVVQVAFFDDAVFNVLIQRSEATSSGGVAYVGKTLSDPLLPVILVDNAGTLFVTLQSQGARYALMGSPETGYVARELLGRDLPDHGPTTLDLTRGLLPRSLNGAQGDPILVTPPTAQHDDGSTMDVMVVYTPAAVAGVGSIALMNASVDAQVTLTNTVYANSNVVQRLRLVYKGQVTYTEVNMDVDLPRITTGGDGYLDEVPILRDLYKADFVSLWGVYSDYCGLGWLMATENAAFQVNGYNVVNSPLCTTGSYTWAHELGHNMGLRHDIFVDASPNTNVTPEAGGAAVNIGYAKGYIDLTNRFRTVMSYDNKCQDSGFSCTRIPYFSNPSVSFNNNGSYGPAVLATTGNAASAHERQALNDTRETTSNFRAGLVSFTGPGVISMMLGTYSVSEGAGTVQIRVGRHVGSTGAVSVNYTTSNGTASSGADYTTTSGTLNWAAADTAEKFINVPILQDPTLEGNETFTVTLSAPAGGATLGTSVSSIVTILDDEPDFFPATALLPGGYSTPNVPNPNTPDSRWTVDTAFGYQSTASVRSASAYSPVPFVCCSLDVSQTGTSDLEYTGVFRAGDVTFRYKLSGYQGLSGFEFQVDGVALVNNTTSGEVDWTAVTKPITAGIHTLRWRFKNNLQVSCANINPPATGGANCADRVWIDAVSLPLAKPFDFSGDGRTDLVMQGTDGTQSVWVMNGTGSTGTADLVGAATGWAITGVGDLNGDGKSDIVWTNTDGRVALWLMNGLTATSTLQILNAGAGWSVIHTPDVNGDGKADLLFQHTDGSVAVWLMNGTAMTSGASIMGPGTGWSVILTGDFDGDGKDDLLWRHTDGRHAIWLMNGITAKATQQILNAGGWTATHLADLNGDGRMDIVWTHSDGTIATWLIEGSFMASGSGLLNAGTGWSVAATGDFNGDGKADILFRHTDGRHAIYLMNGSTPTATAQILNAGGWTAKRTGDLNGDGKADILWQHTNGNTAVWLMDGMSVIGSADLLGAGSTFSIGTMSP